MEAKQMHCRWTFGLRPLMMLVALVALTCFGGSLMQRRHYDLKEAQRHASRARELDSAQGRFWFNDALVHYHEGLALKYQQAAQRPWLAIKPDPPAPRR